MKPYNIYAPLLCALTMQSAAIAQQLDVQPVSLFGKAQTINPIVVDSVLYFASDKRNEFAKTYYDQNDNHLFRIYGVNLRNNKPDGQPFEYFEHSNRPYNQVAITFNKEGAALVTQNNMAAFTAKGAPLSIFEFASNDGTSRGQRLGFLPLRSNCALPSISPDGQLMIFASDRVDAGEGRSDLYYCEKTTTGWSEPKNMGPMVNTPGVETSPFIHSSGKIFFSSNGRDDSQKLDIYYTFRTPDGFAKPVKFDKTANSKADDYGIFYSDDEEWGYLTSNRNGRDEIFYFSQTLPELGEGAQWEALDLCYTFYESSAENYDTTMFVCKWTFGDGQEAKGLEVDHCFPGPGVYQVELSVIDLTSGEEMFSLAQYELELEKPEQINIAHPETVKVGEKVRFTADADDVKSFTPSYFYWDFGNGQKAKGQQAQTIFSEPGLHKVKCGTIAVEDPTTELCTWIEIDVQP